MIENILENRQVVDFSIREHNYCTLSLSDEYSISIECLVRFVGKDDNIICANDNVQEFGLGNPFDAEEKIK